MNRDFVYNYQNDEHACSSFGGRLNTWLWRALCCGIPGVPCYFCSCCKKDLDSRIERDGPRLNEATATAERLSRQHRPNAPRSRKSTPETISAVRCALSQLQGEPAPTLQVLVPEHHNQEPG